MRLRTYIGERRDMEFNKDHLVIIETLTAEEAKAFVKFLGSEIIRHYDDILQAEKLIKEVEKRFG